jgi:hypothetical protein
MPSCSSGLSRGYAGELQRSEIDQPKLDATRSLALMREAGVFSGLWAPHLYEADESAAFCAPLLTLARAVSP